MHIFVSTFFFLYAVQYVLVTECTTALLLPAFLSEYRQQHFESETRRLQTDNIDRLNYVNYCVRFNVSSSRNCPHLVNHILTVLCERPAFNEASRKCNGEGEPTTTTFFFMMHDRCRGSWINNGITQMCSPEYIFV